MFFPKWFFIGTWESSSSWVPVPLAAFPLTSHRPRYLYIMGVTEFSLTYSLALEICMIYWIRMIDLSAKVGDDQCGRRSKLRRPGLVVAIHFPFALNHFAFCAICTFPFPTLLSLLLILLHFGSLTPSRAISLVLCLASLAQYVHFALRISRVFQVRSVPELLPFAAFYTLMAKWDGSEGKRKGLLRARSR